MNYVEAYDTVFIPINNTLNSFCYHLTVVQQLHMSPTFNKLIHDYISGNVYIDTMLEPFKIYSDVNVSNRMEIHKRMRESYSKLINTVISEHGKNGYSPFILLYFYILPIVYRCFPDQFKQICIEASIDPIFLKSPDVGTEYQISTSPLIKNEFIDEQKQMTKELTNAHITFEKGPFKGCILEVYPDKHSFDGGHALFLLKNKDIYYVFDDDTTLDLFKDYVNNRNDNVNRICIRGIDDATSDEIQQLWGGDILKHRVNNRYEYVNDRNNKRMVDVIKSFITIHSIPTEEQMMQMSGGSHVNEDKHTAGVILLVLFVLLIIITVVVSIVKYATKSTTLADSKNGDE